VNLYGFVSDPYGIVTHHPLGGGDEKPAVSVI
jgi:hypothetical protein